LKNQAKLQVIAFNTRKLTELVNFTWCWRKKNNEGKYFPKFI